MNTIKIKYFLWQYKKEISEGEYTHVKDLIALFTIINLSKSFPIDKYYNFNAISLSSLLSDMTINSDDYKVPSLDILNMQIDEYNEYRKEKNNSFLGEKKYAAFNWLKLMIEFNIINEGDIINLENYTLANFIRDEKLIKMFHENGLEYISFDDKLAKILKK